MTVRRWPIRRRPGFDCIYDHANCPACQAGGENKHGISGGLAFLAVQTELTDGRRAVLVLEVLDNQFPSTIPEYHWSPGYDHSTCRGGVLSLHIQGGTEPCMFMEGANDRCESEALSYVAAHELYKRLGNRTDVTQQSEAFWLALEAELAAAIRNSTKAAVAS